MYFSLLVMATFKLLYAFVPEASDPCLQQSCDKPKGHSPKLAELRGKEYTGCDIKDLGDILHLSLSPDIGEANE